MARRKGLRAVVVAVLDDQVFEKEGRGRRPPATLARENAEVMFPYQVSLHVVTDKAGRSKKCVDPAAVRDTRGRGVTVPFMGLARHGAFRRQLLPKDFAVRGLNAQNIALIAVGTGGRQKNVIAPHDGR